MESNTYIHGTLGRVSIDVTDMLTVYLYQGISLLRKIENGLVPMMFQGLTLLVGQ